MLKESSKEDYSHADLLQELWVMVVVEIYSISKAELSLSVVTWSGSKSRCQPGKQTLISRAFRRLVCSYLLCERKLRDLYHPIQGAMNICLHHHPFTPP